MLYLCLERRGCEVFANVSLFLPSEYLNDEVSECWKDMKTLKKGNLIILEKERISR